ncbi:hypothetical protein SSP24_38880 [Streptomyces spinoverrucosus]|uniref:DUF4331 domain-containing protein n=1 Tax=Streptomyces spinoverrucosus TaxID=284043 RepID=A0A4Y3VI75_9ACTN|nr:DUF4331 family protein [Streptomyces spinoverrucosus]GEC06233.1 hypothetical protein SSP24_38880 [Streptomyces spinoverrucosus]GHB75593.1 hypothetical protein GCM10010397_52450 [Streptomyces spinoverrucosus]
MSHHLDSPVARQDPRLDITDLYVFRGERGTVFVTNHSHSLAGEDIPRGLHPEGRYEFKIDGIGDAVEDLTYRFSFSDADADGTQGYELRRLAGPEAGDAFAEGTVIARGRTGTAVDLDAGGRVWVGRAGDPFWIEPDVLHAVGHAFQDGTTVDLSSWNPAEAKNLFAGHTVYSIVLEIADEELLPVAGDDQRIGVWGLASLATDAGGWRPVNRAGLPMIHPLFTQFDEDLGDRLNENVPSDDVQLHGKLLTEKVAGVVRAYGTAEDPEAYARTVVERILPNVLPYTVGTPAAYGFAGWNGRSLTDNAPDVMFSFAANTPVTLGIGKESVTARPPSGFPYVPAAS